MAEINLLEHYPRSNRPINERGARKLSGEGYIEIDASRKSTQETFFEQLLLNKARQFDRAYFDGDRLFGYGGYHYNPKFWTDTVKLMRNHYDLTENSSLLDVGCAKGFMLYDFKKLMPQLNIAGVDISQYAYDNSMPDIKPYIRVASADELPFKDKSFDLVVSVNTVDHLPLQECKKAISEIQRVARRNAFITVNAWRTEKEKENLLKWNITAQTAMHVDDWKKLFKEVNYTHDYYWFIVE